MSLTLKFFGSVTCLITIIISLVLLTTLNNEKMIIESNMQKKGSTLAEVLSMASVNAFLVHDYSTLMRHINTVSKDEDIISVMITDNDGIVKMHSDISQIGRQFKSTKARAFLTDKNSVFTEQRITKSGKIYHFSTRIMADSQPLGLISLEMSAARMLSEMKASQNRLLFIGLMAIIIGGLGAVFMGRMISRPLRQLAECARVVSTGDLTWKVDIKTKDDIGVLAEAFGYMIHNLRKSIESLILAEKMSSIGELAATIAHEVRNPMEPIKGSAEIILQTFPDNEKVCKYTKIIKDEINNVCSFLDQFLNFARPPEHTVGQVNVNKVINQVLSLADYYIYHHQIKLVKNLDKDIPLIQADSRQIKQLFLNLVMNAVQAMPEQTDAFGKITITSTVCPLKVSDLKTSTCERPHVCVEFWDFGQGIAPEDMDRIFDPFYTTKEHGTGLGLATCQTIMNQHNGTITIDSEQGKWTRISVYFPMVD